jgi:hypothetical protein
MKKIMMIAALMVATLSASAQNEVGQFTLKPTVGMNIATMTKTTDSKVRVGMAAGVEAEYGVAEKFGISAGVLYSMQGVKSSENLMGADVDYIYKLDYINIPILAQYYIVPGLAIKAGIQPAFKASAKRTIKASADGTKAERTDDLDDVKGFALSIPFGVSYEYKSFVLDARYNLGVTKAFKDSWNTDSKNSWFMISLGYKFAL